MIVSAFGISRPLLTLLFSQEHYIFTVLPWELHYKDDEEEGVFTSYYSDGTVKLSGSYKSGSKIGLWTYYTMNGKKSGVVGSNKCDTRP